MPLQKKKVPPSPPQIDVFDMIFMSFYLEMHLIFIAVFTHVVFIPATGFIKICFLCSNSSYSNCAKPETQS